MARTPERRTGNNCASGPKTIHRLSPTSTPWFGRDRPHRKARRRRHASVRAGHPLGARARLRAERGPRQRIGRAILRGARLREDRAGYLVATPGTAISLGRRTARCGNSIGLIRISRSRSAAALREQRSAPSIDHLDLASVVKVSQAVSGEIVLEKLIDPLMRSRSSTPARSAAC